MPVFYGNQLLDDDQIYLKLTDTTPLNSATFSGVQGQSVFAFDYVRGLIDVKLNGKRLKRSTYIATNGTSVTLATPIANNYDVLTIDGFMIEGSQNAAGNFLAYSGTANAITLTSNNAQPAKSYKDGAQYRFRATTANTGATTISVDGLPAKACKTIAGEALSSGNISTDIESVATYYAAGDSFVVFSEVGDAVLRQDLANPDMGARLVGINNTTVQGFYGEKVSIESFGVVPGGDASDAFDAARTALSGTDRVLFLPNTTYSISRTVRLDGLNVCSDGCEIQKDFDGVGIEIQGGADYFDLEGTLYLRGINAGFYDPTLPGATAPANPNAHGFWFNGARIRIRGKIICQYHQGDLYRFTCSGNMNKTNINAIWGWWGGRGVYFEGVQDDFSVCEINLFSQFTWGSGVATSSDFSGRGWKGYWYSEGCSIDGVSHGMDLKKLRSCDLEIYCEQQNESLEIVLGAACTNNTIRSQRRNKDQDLTGASGYNSWLAGNRVYNPGYSGDARVARPLVIRGDRPRAESPGEYVECIFTGGETILGSVRGEGGATSPYVKLMSADGGSAISLANNDFSVSVGGTQLMKHRSTGVTLGFGNFSMTGAENGKEVDRTTTSMKSSRSSTSARDHIEFYNPNGKIGGISTSSTATTYATSSDRRLKENIKGAGSASDVIDAIQVVQYDWLADGSHDDWGVVAQQVAEVYPRAVIETDLFMVDYSKFVPLLIKEIQDLRARVASIEVSNE